MKFGAFAGPEQIEVMCRVLDAYCRQTGIAGQVERENVAARIIAIHELGLTKEDELLAAVILPPRRKGGKSSSVR